MDGLLLRICGLGLVCLIACVVLRQMKSELVPLVRIAGILLMMGALLPVLDEIRGAVDGLIADSAIGTYADVMLRGLGIALLCKICCDVCKDAGEGALAGGVEMAGKAVILLLCVPMLEELLGYAATLLREY